jgi:hypothetical protein
MRRQLWVLALALVLAGCENQREVNEYYRGKKLRAWMEDIAKGEEPQMSQAVGVVNSISEDDVDLVPALAELLKDPNRYVRWWSLHALGNIGPKAKDALPDIERTWMNEKDRGVLQKGLEVWRKVANLPTGKKT